MSLFVNQLKRLDKSLFFHFNPKISRFVVYRKDRKGVPNKVIVIEDEQGQFCNPNYNHIAKLYQMDSWQNKNIIKDMDEHNENLDKESNEQIRRISYETSMRVTRTKFY